MDRYHFQTTFSQHISLRLAGETFQFQRKRVGTSSKCFILLYTAQSGVTVFVERHYHASQFWMYAVLEGSGRTERPYPGRSSIICDVHCTINTEKCLLNFASQWYNYFYYQTYAGSYYKNAKLLLPVSPRWPSLMIFCLIAGRFCSLLHTRASVQIPH